MKHFSLSMLSQEAIPQVLSKGIGKVKPLKILLKDKKYISVFASLGNIWQEREELDRELEDFTCTIFGYSRIKSVDLLRYTILKKKCDDKDQIDPKKH